MEWLLNKDIRNATPFVYLIRYCNKTEKSSEVPFFRQVVLRRFIFFLP